MWMALRETEARPGTALDWLLIVKHGRDARTVDPRPPADPPRVVLR
jgi:hypothetical protein